MSVFDRDDLNTPSHYATRLLETLRPGGTWHAVGQELLGQGLPIPSDALALTLGALLDTAFYASMTTEEGRRATFSLALGKPAEERAHVFAAPIPVTVKALRKLSAGCDGNRTYLHVWFEAGMWSVFGVSVRNHTPQRSQKLRHGDHRLQVIVRDAGVVEVRWRDDILFSYAEGKGVVLDDQLWVAALVQAALPLPSSNRLALHHLVAIHRAMRQHGSGGALLVVPEMLADHDLEIAYRVGGPKHGPLPHAAINEDHMRRGAGSSERDGEPASPDVLDRYAVDRTEAECGLVGRLTAIDGMVVMDHGMAVHGFGVKMPVPEQLGSVRITHIDGRSQVQSETTIGKHFAGMRHKSAAAAFMKLGTGMALVQSQDGALTVILAKDKELTVISPLALLVSPDHRWQGG